MRLSRTILIAGLTSALACPEHFPPMQVYDGVRQGETTTFVIEPSLAPGVRQVVDLSSITLRRGDTLAVYSSIGSTDTTSISTLRDCPLRLSSRAALAPAECDGTRIERMLVPGVSLAATGRLIIAGKPGRYDVYITHIVSPGVIMRVPVTVE